MGIKEKEIHRIFPQHFVKKLIIKNQTLTAKYYSFSAEYNAYRCVCQSSLDR